MAKPNSKTDHPETTTASEDTSSATKPTIALRLQGVSKRYPGSRQPAVQDLSLDVCDGEIVTLLGPSGCGKTTTLRMAAGLEVPDDGEIILAIVQWLYLPTDCLSHLTSGTSAWFSNPTLFGRI